VAVPAESVEAMPTGTPLILNTTAAPASGSPATVSVAESDVEPPYVPVAGATVREVWSLFTTAVREAVPTPPSSSVTVTVTG
jgi:hypothetical protein